jgi:hypothetical protein
MSIGARYEGGNLRYFDKTTQETVHVMAPLYWKDDFNNQALDSTVNWTALDTGAATEALVEDAPNGVVALSLDATSEAQLAGLSWNDKRQLVLNQGLNIEYRFRFSTLPSASTSIAALGLAGDHNATLDTVAESIWFRADGNGAITVENDDTSNETSKVATGVTVTTSDWVVARIDCTNIADIIFYINGNRVAGGTTFTMATVPTLALQPYARISKASSTSLGVIQIDKVMIWQNRT